MLATIGSESFLSTRVSPRRRCSVVNPRRHFGLSPFQCQGEWEFRHNHPTKPLNHLSRLYCHSLMISFFAFLLFCPSKGNASQRVTNGEVFRYDFIRSDCLSGSIPQTSENRQLLGSLIIDKVNALCPQNNGVKLSSNIPVASVKDGLTSSTDLSLLLTNFKNKNIFTFAFWIDVGKTTQSASQSLLAFSSTSTSSACQPLQVNNIPDRICNTI
jgi:hypothetical protein